MIAQCGLIALQVGPFQRISARCRLFKRLLWPTVTLSP